jgi:hypothetical protein
MGNWQFWQFNDLTPSGAPRWIWLPIPYVFKAQGTQHIIYGAGDVVVSAGDPQAKITNVSINELWCDANGWHHNDLTAAAGAPAGWPTTGYAFEAQGTQHVIYIGGVAGGIPRRPTDLFTIHELWWDPTGWHHNDLTATIGAPEPWGEVSGFALDAEYTQHLIYGGKDGHIHELWWDTNGWHHHDLSATTGAPGGFPIAYKFEAQGTVHAVYSSETDNHVYELWRDAGGWHLNDLTTAAGAPAVDNWFALTGYAFNAQYTQHVIYVEEIAPFSKMGRIHELWWDTNGWHHNDLTAATGAPYIPEGNSLAAYACDAQYTQHVYYVNDGLAGDNPGDPNHVHELWWDTDGWHHSDLTAATGPPDIPLGPGLAGYALDLGHTQHVAYTALRYLADGQDWEHRIYELYGDTSTRLEVPWLPPKFQPPKFEPPWVRQFGRSYAVATEVRATAGNAIRKSSAGESG